MPDLSRRRPGRPFRAAEPTRTHAVRLTDTEWAAIEAAAAQAGTTPGAWMRDLAVSVARGQQVAHPVELVCDRSTA